MGLTTGPNGVKEFVKSSCPAAVHELNALSDVHSKFSCSTNEVVVVLDGNVLVRQIPTSITTFDEYCTVFCKFVNNALDAGEFVAIVFDDYVTRAKSDEQKKRDLNSKKKQVICSADFEDLIPKTDDFSFQKLCELNPHDLIAQRKARPRFFDAVCKRAFIELTPRLQRENKRLLFDGIDPRGADRPTGSKRTPTMVSNDFVLAERLCRDSNAPCGEGDIKITDLCSEIQFMRDTLEDFLDVKLFLIVTIDTDSIAIELMNQSSKIQQFREQPELGAPTVSLLCLRNSKANRTPKDDDVAVGVFTCIDIEDAHAALLERMGAPRQFERHAMTLLCVLWAIQKSDFIFTPGSKKAMDRFINLQTICSHHNARRVLRGMRTTWELRREDDAKKRAETRKAVAKCIHSALGADVLEMTLARAAWIAVYWSGLQLPDTQLSEWGFPDESVDLREAA
jgi:hypothetical protein